jgi:Homocysteine/selenocysteine methylase (S-methylmethionine-dependent)
MTIPAFTVLDGGLSTQLEVEGADFSGELWTARALLETPLLVERAHRAFVEAGGPDCFDRQLSNLSFGIF